MRWKGKFKRTLVPEEHANFSNRNESSTPARSFTFTLGLHVTFALTSKKLHYDRHATSVKRHATLLMTVLRCFSSVELFFLKHMNCFYCQRLYRQWQRMGKSCSCFWRQSPGFRGRDWPKPYSPRNHHRFGLFGERWNQGSRGQKKFWSVDRCAFPMLQTPNVSMDNLVRLPSSSSHAITGAPLNDARDFRRPHFRGLFPQLLVSRLILHRPDFNTLDVGWWWWWWCTSPENYNIDMQEEGHFRGTCLAHRPSPPPRPFT